MKSNKNPNVYMDYAAATPMDLQVINAMEPYYTKFFYNPSAAYLKSRTVRQDLSSARQNIASTLGVRPGEIIFTSGATESNNLAIDGIMDAYPEAELLVGAIEHDSVLLPAKKYKYRLAAVNSKGLVDIEKLKQSVTSKTVLISIALANNELGSLQPIADISKQVTEIRRNRLNSGNKLPLLLHTDAAQAGNSLKLSVARLGVDLLSLNGGKIYGPKNSGILVVKAGIKLNPQISGGGQEFGLRSGTENIAGAAGLAKALELAQYMQPEERTRLCDLRKHFIAGLAKSVPEASINGSQKHTLPHILSVTFPGKDNERLMMELDEYGIMCATGSACSASSSEPSHVLSAIGLSDKDAQSTIRFSLGRQTSKNDIDYCLKILQKLLS